MIGPRMLQKLGIDGMGRVQRAFDLMGVAEDEIASAKRRHPTKARELHGCFMLIAPTESLALLSDQVYRAHARELLDRVAVGQDTRLGTSAEILAAMSRGSLVAPPTELWAHLMERLFNQVMGPQVFLVDASAPREGYPGAADELQAELARKLADDKRRL